MQVRCNITDSMLTRCHSAHFCGVGRSFLGEIRCSIAILIRKGKKFGAAAPYFGVATETKYLKVNLTADNRTDFFKGGNEHMANVLRTIKQHIDPHFSPKLSLDFGCGVGRLVIPIAGFSGQVVGIDVSQSMLDEAKKNCAERGLKNVALLRGDDSLSAVNGCYDFINSFIVFQHIPTERGMQIFEHLLARMNTGGVGVLHFTYGKRLPPKQVAKHLFVKYVPFGVQLLNLAGGRPSSAPVMQMNNYDLNQIFRTLQAANVGRCHVTYEDHGGYLGVVIYFKKP
jgi:SAM-dependent methyltransferase